MIEKLMFKLGLTKVSNQHIANWEKAGNIDLLNWAYHNAGYKIREQAILSLEKLGERDTIITAINDDVKTVSLTSIALIEKNPQAYPNTEALLTKIEAKKKYWIAKEEAMKEAANNSSSRLKDKVIEGKERPSDRLMKRLERQRSQNKPGLF
ncbi:MAG: hypothetical protein AAFX87_23405 [Bacteroidota bacterium]